MMHTYKHKFWIANEEIFSSINLVDYKDTICEAIEHYNDVSERARNPKRIFDFNVTEKYIILMSESVEPLARPNLALQVFSSFLANGKMQSMVRNKALFRGEAKEITSEDETKNMSEDELLLEIIKIFRRSASVENRKKIEEIRKIVC